jgi:hypothetical protein
MSSVIHICPPKGWFTMPCCGQTPFDTPLTDRMTMDPGLVTCHADLDFPDAEGRV